MEKYIRAQDLIDRIYPVDPENDGADGCTIVFQNLKLSSPEIEAIVEEIPAADVAPVVHGHWEPIIDSYENVEGWICACGRESKEMCNFCPNCGAKMDK